MDSNVIEGFKKDFLAIKNRGFVPSNRLHDTGIGKTFEDLMQIVENNNHLADYKGILELKSKRSLSESMFTLFTKSPSFPKGVNSKIREKYGKPDKKFPDCKVVHSTISALKFNTFLEKYGFKIEIDKAAEKISMLIKDLAKDETIEKDIHHSFADLKNVIEEKCKYMAVIYADTKKENKTEYFHFTKAILLTGLTFSKFIELVEQGIIVYDIRLGVYSSGKNAGKPHDHGSGFRVLKRNLDKIFKVEEI